MIRTLVVAPSWVGDTVMALPVLEALAAADRRLTVLARPHLAPLLELAPSVAEVLPRPADPAETVQRLQGAACHEAVVLPNSFRTAWLVWRAGIPYRWGYRGDWRSLLLQPPVQRPRRRRGHQVEDYRLLLEAMGVPLPPSWQPRLELPPALEESITERLERAGLEDRRLVGLFPGAEFGPSKRWPWRRFADLAQSLRRARPELGVAVVVGPKEVWLGVRIFEESGRIHPVLGAEMDLAQLAALLARLEVLVTNDSGPMHLAAAVGTRCVALFGPTDPRRTAPAGPGHRVLYTDRWCSPCFRRRCPLLHHRCLRDIGVAEVTQATLEALGSPATPP